MDIELPMATDPLLRLGPDLTAVISGSMRGHAREITMSYAKLNDLTLS